MIEVKRYDLCGTSCQRESESADGDLVLFSGLEKARSELSAEKLKRAQLAGLLKKLYDCTDRGGWGFDESLQEPIELALTAEGYSV